MALIRFIPLACCLWLWALILLATSLPVRAAQAAALPSALSLPNTASPLHYALHFTLDPAQPRFSAEGTLTISLNQAARSFTLHGQDLQVTPLGYIDAEGKPGKFRYRQMHGDGVAQIDFDRRLPAQTLSLRMRWQGAIGSSAQGLYRMHSAAGPLLLTQLQAVSARSVFPSFDEPRYKTPYAVELTVPRSAVAAANTRALEQTLSDDGKRVTYRYATTPPMPSYLLAFTVGPWQVSETQMLPASAQRGRAVPLRLLAPAGADADAVARALSRVGPMLSALEAELALPYPFDKLDLVAAPNLAGAGMENLGLLSFREDILLLDAAAPIPQQQAAAETLAHELAHQWFGNWVTPSSWDDLWLSEAFANHLGSKIVEGLHPDWPVALQRTARSLAVMHEDALPSATRLREPVRRYGDIANAFSDIAYDKGAAVVQMLEQWSGAKGFRSALHELIKYRARGSTNAAELLQLLQDFGSRGPQFSAVAKSFLDQPGLPLVTVQQTCKDGRGVVQLQQRRELPLGAAASAATWTIPVCMKLGDAQGAATTCVLLTSPAQEVTLEQCPTWLMPNANADGYYRWQLDAGAERTLLAAYAQLSAPEQAAVGANTAAGFLQGRQTLSELAEVLRASSDSPQLEVVTSAWSALAPLRQQLLAADAKAAFAAELKAIYQPLLQRLGASAQPNEPATTRSLRAALFRELALGWRLPEFVAALRTNAEAILPAGDAVLDLAQGDADLRASALRLLVAQEPERAMPKLAAALRQQPTAAVRAALLAAWGSSARPQDYAAIRTRILEPQLAFADRVRLLYAHAEVPAARASFLPWLLQNLPALQGLLGDDFAHWLPDIAGGSACSKADAAQLAQGFKKHIARIAGGPQALQIKLDAIQHCAALAQALAAQPIAQRASP